MSDKGRRLIKQGLFIVNIILVVLSVLAMVKSIFVGFDIDEGYAIAQSYRLVTGDKMFADMWEPHQLSAYASAFFMLPFLLLTGGDTTGIVLYLRIIGTLLHLCIACGFYKAASRRFDKNIGLLIALLHLNFLSKWIVLPEFEIMQYWATCIIFLALMAWIEKPAKKYLIISGAALFTTLLSYPTMILLYPVYVGAVFVLGKETKKEKWLAVLWFTIPALLLGIGFLLYLFSYMSIDEFVKYISYIFMDESHSVGLDERMTGYGEELLRLGEQILEYLPKAVMITLVVAGLQLLGVKKGILHKEKSVSAFVVMLLLVLTGVFAMEHVWGTLFEDKNQFFLYFRFLWVVVLGIVGGCLYKKNKLYVWLGILPGMVGGIASVLITNMTLEIAMARIYIGVMATCFILATLWKEKYPENGLLKGTGYVVAIIFLGGLLICKLLLVRVTGCIPVTVRMDMAWVTEGPVAGMLIEHDLAKQYNENIPLIKEYAKEEDNLFYFGCEHVYYMVSGAKIATPSVQGTAVFNEMYLEYFEEHPDKLPNVVVVDKTFETNPYVRYSDSNYIVLEWITENFEGMEVLETDNIIIYKK